MTACKFTERHYISEQPAASIRTNSEILSLCFWQKSCWSKEISRQITNSGLLSSVKSPFLLIFTQVTEFSADHSGRAVWGINRLRSLERWDRGFESHSRHGCLYSVCVFLRVGSGLATGWSPVQGVLPTLYRIKKLKKVPRSNKGL
jgi:hypothetical protein